MREPVIVNEVGLRDGLQLHPGFVATADKLRLLQRLLDAGVRHVEATSFVSPKAVPQLADAAELYTALPDREHVHYTALVPNQRGYQRAVAAGARAVAVVLAATDTLNRRNIGLSLDEATAVCEAVIRDARADGVTTRAYVAAAAACPYEGVTPPAVVVALAERMLAAGADEIAVADTIGAGHPAQLKDLLATLVAGCGAARLAVHFHDTRAMGLALAWVAAEQGIRRFDSSFGGLGGCPFAPGASGNLATEDLVFMLEEAGFDTGIDLPALMQAVAEAERLLDRPLGGRITRWYRSRRL